MPQSFAAVYLHVIFSTKRREPLITPDLAARLYPYMIATADGNHNRVVSIGEVR